MVKRSGQQRTARRAPLTAEMIEMVAAVLRALGDPTRIRLIELLNERGGATVSALAACVPVSQQRVSQQLAVLHEVGILRRVVGLSTLPMTVLKALVEIGSILSRLPWVPSSLLRFGPVG